MHTYRKSRDEELWTVGYWRIDRNNWMRWEPLTDFANEADAIMRVNILNGGNAEIVWGGHDAILSRHNLCAEG